MSDFDPFADEQPEKKPKGTGQFPKKHESPPARGASPVPEELAEFEGVVDHDFLADQRFPVEFRLEMARLLALGEVTPSDAAASAKKFLEQDLAQESSGADSSKNVKSAAAAEDPVQPHARSAPDLTLPEQLAAEMEALPEEPPITVEEAGAAQVEMIEATKAGAITTAASLLPPEEEETPPPPEASEPPPPGERHGPFLVQDKAYGPGTTRVLIELPSGAYVPVGVWLHEQHPDLSPDGVVRMLTEMGLPATYAETFARHRSHARPTEEVLREAWGDEAYEGSAFHAAAEMEKKHWQTKDAFSRAFIEAQRKKEKR